jgi:uncharacterized GH25 family protein
MRTNLSRLAAAVLTIVSSASALRADTLKGVVRDRAGAPVAGARVDISTAGPKVGRGVFCPSCYADCAKFTTTDQNGAFEFTGLDPTLKFSLLSTATGKQTTVTKLLDPLVDAAELVLEDFPADLPPGRLLKGIVVSTSGAPIPGALVEPAGGKTPAMRWYGSMNAKPAVTDDQGRFQVLLGEDFQGVDLSITATGYAGTDARLLTPGPREHRITVPSGTSVRGQIVHKGRPLEGIHVAVVQADRGAGNHFIKAVAAVTGRDGTFQISALPADQDYVVFSAIGGRTGPELVLTTKQFGAKLDGEVRDIGPLEVQEGHTLSGRVEMHDGSPLPKGIKMILGRDPAWDLIEVPLDETGQFEMTDLPPEAYEVFVRAEGFNLDCSALPYQSVSDSSFGILLRERVDGLRLVLKPSSKKQIARQLDDQVARPTGKGPKGEPATDQTGVQLGGRILRNGKPVAGMKITVTRSRPDGPNRWKGAGSISATTDAEGRYLLDGLAPGDGYSCEVATDDDEMVAGWRYGPSYLHRIAEGVRGILELPDANLVTANQSISGQVVDPQGQPVQGVNVGAELSTGGNIPRRGNLPPPWTETDSQGRFHLTGLPAESIQLHAYKRNPNDTRIRYMVRLTPTQNQSDVRIVLDPALQKPIERLPD